MYLIINTIFQIFPSYQKEIDLLYQDDQNFRDICSDYLLCSAMVLEKQNEGIKTAEFAEFVALQKDMKAEILNEILKIKTPS